MATVGRKIVWVLGAGASRGVGAFVKGKGGGKRYIPIQSDFWPTILHFATNKNRKTIQSFLFRYFTEYDRVPATLKQRERAELLRNIDVEEVFTFVSERLQSRSTSPSLKTYFKEEVWPILVDETGRTIRKFKANEETKRIYRKLAKSIKSKDAVISFNYDTVFESSIRSKWHYYGIESGNNVLPILKPHGSANWAMKNQEIVVRKKDTPDFSPVIVAPTHLKFILSNNKNEDNGDRENSSAEEDYFGYLRPQIDNIWGEMERQMKVAKTIVFIGYSFPVADLYFSSVLRTVLSGRDKDLRIVIVNPDALAISTRLKARFSVNKVARAFDIKSFSSLNREEIEEMD